ncbi:hypothetical protein [Listeria welshimeri]|uniref:hypothetical protein n=1 Tax=Listeria welshimeri TaxID=1643 RepID=UPI00188749BB|nr:hypothetical protein [Listeria welshimeri]MBF2451210.1 hypothetical protein [Listeria welshimeri]MBF2610767.1 hypothetical protein [Listeria welshimeri]
MIHSDHIISYNINLDFLLILNEKLNVDISSIWVKYLKSTLIIPDSSMGEIIDESDYTFNILIELNLLENPFAIDLQEALSNSNNQKIASVILPKDPEQTFFESYDSSHYTANYIILVTREIPNFLPKENHDKSLVIKKVTF